MTPPIIPSFRHPRESGDPVASAGGRSRAYWAPAFAGVTKKGEK